MADDDNHILQPHSDEKPSHNIADHTRPLQTSVFSNGKWYNIGNTLDFMNAQHDMHKVAKVVEQHQVDITNAEKEANDAHSEAQSAIQVSKANSAANSAMSVAVDNIHSLANSAATDALHATSNANIAESSANTALSSANIAYSNADTALTSAEKALSTANFANSTARQNTLSISSTASEMALKANKTDLDKLNGTVDSNSTEISVIAGQIKSKADQTDIDMVKKTVSSNSTEIDQLATGITSKANSQDVDTLKKTVSDNSTEISQLSTGFSSKANASDVNNLAKTLSSSNTEIAQLANQITTKANQQDVNNLKRTVDTHTTELSQTSSEVAAKADQTTVDRINNTVSHNTAQLNMQAGQISSKVDSTTVNELIDERGYATTSAVQSWINQKSDTINETITRLDDKVNTTGGGVNLARNTKDKENVGGLNTSNNIGGLSLEQWNDLRGKTITISVDTQWSGWSFGNNCRNRIGWEICLIYQDGNKDYFGPWTTPKTANGKDRPHITFTVPDEEIKFLDEGASYIQANCSSAKVSNLKIELGSIATPYSSAPSDDASITQIQNLTATIDGIQSTVRGKADQSTVTQLSNVIDSKVAKGDYNTEISQLNHDINLRVQKGQTISQINQEAGGNTLIEVNNGTGTLALDASTVTFSGKAFIPDAAIENLSLDKLTTGSLKVPLADDNGNAISLDESGITISSALSPVTGIPFYGKLDDQSGFYLSLSSKGMKFVNHLVYGQDTQKRIGAKSDDYTFMDIQPDVLHHRDGSTDNVNIPSGLTMYIPQEMSSSLGPASPGGFFAMGYKNSGSALQGQGIKKGVEIAYVNKEINGWLEGFHVETNMFVHPRGADHGIRFAWVSWSAWDFGERCPAIVNDTTNWGGVAFPKSGAVTLFNATGKYYTPDKDTGHGKYSDYQ